MKPKCNGIVCDADGAHCIGELDCICIDACVYIYSWSAYLLQ